MKNVNKLLNIFLFCVAPLFVRAQNCNNTTVIAITGPAAGDWTAPATGGPFSVRITATGAGGGANTVNFNKAGGSGATMAGTFVVQNGQTLRAIAGDFGKEATLEGGGGGGGSGVVNCGNPSNCEEGTILIIAAGGNGGGIVIGTGGSALTNGNGAGGMAGGDPAHEPDWGGGGGGQITDGQNSAGSGGKGGEKVDKTGLSLGGLGSGTQVPNHGGDGMGGGGGGGDFGAGGGGGHTGGNGGDGAAAAKSANTGTSQQNTSGTTGGGNNIGTVTVVCLLSLPVELTSFKAMMPPNGGVNLHWATATEKDNHGFDVERSADGRNWASIGFVPGNGTTAIPQDYLFMDEKPHAGVNYYRLKQNDTDGKFEYSPMVVADVRKDDLEFNVFPNPSNDGTLSFRIVSKIEGAALLEIFDWAGYKLYKEQVRIFAGTTVWPVSLATYPKGAYTARLEMPGGEIQFKKIVLQ